VNNGNQFPNLDDLLGLLEKILPKQYENRAAMLHISPYHIFKIVVILYALTVLLR